MKKEELIQLVESQSGMALAEALAKIPAGDLEGLGAVALKLAKTNPQAEIALARCGTVPQLKKIDWERLLGDGDWWQEIVASPDEREFQFKWIFHRSAGDFYPAIMRALGSRGLDFCSEWAQWICDQVSSHHYKYFNYGQWIGLLRLTAAGFCRWPQSDLQALDMAYYCHWKFWGQPPSEVANFLRPHLSFLEEDIWRLFTFESVLGTTWAGLSENFEDAIILLAAEGALSRPRMLDASLDAITRDYKLVVARHHRKFHDKLAPTPQEMASHAERYLSALGSSNPETQKWAVEQAETLFAAGHVTGDQIFDNLRPLLSHGAKPAVAPALKLMQAILKAQPALAPLAAELACEALVTDAQPVQELAMGFIDKFGKLDDAALRARLAENEFTILAAIKSRFPKWFEKVEPQDAFAESREIAGYVVLDPAHAIAPIADYRELLDVVSLLIESPWRFDEFERFLDGLARLGGLVPADVAALTEPVKRHLGKARDKLKRMWGRTEILHLVLDHWLEGRELTTFHPEYPNYHVDHETFVINRINAAFALHAAKSDLPLLAAPTHRGFWIEPAVLVERTRRWLDAGREPGRTDVIQALLRLSLEQRAEGLRAAKELPGDLGRAIRYALGGDEPGPGSDDAISAAARAARDPLGAINKVGVAGAKWEYLHAVLPNGEYVLRGRASASLIQSLWPQNVERYASGWGAGTFDEKIEDYGHILVAPILEGNQPLGPDSARLVAELFNHIYKEGPALGAEIVIRTVDDGRFAASPIPAALGEKAKDDHLAWPLLPTAIATIIAVSPAHAAAAGKILEAILTHMRTSYTGSAGYEEPLREARNQLAKLLALLEECYAKTGKHLEDPALIANLNVIAKSGKSAAVFKRLRK